MLAHESLPQVLLFHGPEGVGKGLFALAVAEKLLSKQKKDHPDLHILHPEGKSHQHPISAIRELIDEVGMPPFEALCKVFIIHDAEKMLPTSSNALLKTLEEPPADTYVFLISSEPDKLLPTIVSRCRKIAFFPIPDAEISARLNHPGGGKIALMAEGSLAKALKLAERTLDLSSLFQCRNYPELFQALAKLEDLSEEEAKERADEVFEALLYGIRQHRPEKLEKAIEVLQECRTAVFFHTKLKTALEYFFLKLNL
jgi:DNA polymerase-3 subunit delta'